MPDEEKLRFDIGVDTEDYSTVLVWCEGRDYCPCDQAYRPVYAYKIITNHWSYCSNDIRGAANEIPNLNAAAQSLFSFLYSCQEGMPFKPGQLVHDNADLFPEHVREWAYTHNDEISLTNLSLEASNL